MISGARYWGVPAMVWQPMSLTTRDTPKSEILASHRTDGSASPGTWCTIFLSRMFSGFRSLHDRGIATQQQPHREHAAPRASRLARAACSVAAVILPV